MSEREIIRPDEVPVEPMPKLYYLERKLLRRFEKTGDMEGIEVVLRLGRTRERLRQGIRYET